MTPGASDVPVLTTDRLVLRAHTVECFDELAAMWADESVVRHIGGIASSRGDSWQRLLRYRGLWALLGYGYWAICERDSGRYAGDVGFADFHRDLQPSIEGFPEAGWAVAPWAQGRGYATEATRAAHDWLDEHTVHARSACIIDAANLASVRLARTLGYSDPRVATFRGEPVQLFERHRP